MPECVAPLCITVLIVVQRPEEPPAISPGTIQLERLLIQRDRIIDTILLARIFRLFRQILDGRIF